MCDLTTVQTEELQQGFDLLSQADGLPEFMADLYADMDCELESRKAINGWQSAYTLLKEEGVPPLALAMYFAMHTERDGKDSLVIYFLAALSRYSRLQRGDNREFEAELDRAREAMVAMHTSAERVLNSTR